MCLVSDKIKFCTCISESVESLQHYWVLYKVSGVKGDIIGLTIAPTSSWDKNYMVNESTLLQRINEADSFDIDLKPEEKDKLEIVINSKSTNSLKTSTYYFEFRKGKWISSDADAFELMNNFYEGRFGKLKSAFKKK